jgi:hypothetical protein
MVPNLHAVMAESPALMEAYRTAAEIFDNKTNLSTTKQQIIAMTNNRLNGCTYCMAAQIGKDGRCAVRVTVLKPFPRGNVNRREVSLDTTRWKC